MSELCPGRGKLFKMLLETFAARAEIVHPLEPPCPVRICMHLTSKVCDASPSPYLLSFQPVEKITRIGDTPGLEKQLKELKVCCRACPWCL